MSEHRNFHDMVLAHDYLIQMGGAERVVASMVRKHPEAPLYTSAMQRETLLPEFRSANLRPSWMQRLPRIEIHFKKFFVLYPTAFRSFGEIQARNLWVSASTFAKCIRFSPQTASVLYCHNPTRVLWQSGEEYVDSEVRFPLANFGVRMFVPYLRRVDFKAAQKFDVIVANSEAVRRRIQAIYRRDAMVIHPPVQLDRFIPTPEHDGYYIVVSRLVAYKGLDRAVVACSRTGRRLLVIGEGPDRRRLEGMAESSVSFLGWKSDEEVQDLVQRSRGLIFPAEEDFGIAPVEAQACGKPVIAYAQGGALETVIEGKTGCFFQERTAEALENALDRAETISWNAAEIRLNAERFSEDHFHLLTSQAMATAAEIVRGRNTRRAAGLHRRASQTSSNPLPQPGHLP